MNARTNSNNNSEIIPEQSKTFKKIDRLAITFDEKESLKEYLQKSKKDLQEAEEINELIITNFRTLGSNETITPIFSDDILKNANKKLKYLTLTLTQFLHIKDDPHPEFLVNILSFIKANLDTLEYLNVNDNFCGDGFINDLINVLHSSVTLKGLNLRYANIKNPNAIVSLLNNHRVPLTYLSLSKNLLNNDIFPILNSIKMHPTLTNFDMSNSVDSNIIDCAPELADMIKNNHHLTHLNLHGCNFYDNQGKIIIDALIENQSIQSVDLSNYELFSNCGLKSASANSLTKLLQTNKVLKTLFLSNNVSLNLNEFVDGFSPEMVLKNLDISNIQTNEESLMKLLNKINLSQTFRSLNLSGAIITTKVAKFISAILKENIVPLEYLNIKNCPINDTDLQAIIHALQSNNKLRQLIITDCYDINFPTDIIKELVTTLTYYNCTLQKIFAYNSETNHHENLNEVNTLLERNNHLASNTLDIKTTDLHLNKMVKDRKTIEPEFKFKINYSLTFLARNAVLTQKNENIKVLANDYCQINPSVGDKINQDKSEMVARFLKKS